MDKLSAPFPDIGIGARAGELWKLSSAQFDEFERPKKEYGEVVGTEGIMTDCPT